MHLYICHSQPLDSDVLGRDYNHAEYVSVDLFKRLLPSSNYQFYICGPPPMMDAIRRGLEQWGVPKKHVHWEKFGPAPRAKPQKPVSPEDAAAGVSVTFQKQGKTLTWTVGVGTLLELARSHNIELDAGCESGSCGECQVAVRAGQVEYDETPDYRPADGTCLTCCGRPKGPLVLDA